MQPEPDRSAPPVAHLDLKARLLLWGVLLLLAASVAYVLYARGAFERKQTLVLVADNSEGVVVGMDLTFAGFPIGRVVRIELSEQGDARIVIDVPLKDAHWLRESSVFTMERGLVGATRIRAFSGILGDPPLPDGALRKVLSGDATAEIPRLVAGARDLLANLTALSAADAPLANTLRHVETTSSRLAEPGGALRMLLGDEQGARQVSLALERANALLARLDGVARRIDGLVARTDTIVGKADAQVLGASGVLPETRAAMVQLNGLLADARDSLKKADGVLQEAQGIASNARAASVDLGGLRAEVEASLRKIEHLVNEVNRKWPFARDAEVRLP